MDRSEQPLIRRVSAWNWLVAASAGLLLVCGLAVGVSWALSSEERVSSYDVRGSLQGVNLDLGDADLEIVGGGSVPRLNVRRTDSFAFGQASEAGRRLVDGELRLTSHCPPIVLGSCSASYRLQVPDNVPVTVRTDAGDVSFNEFRGSARIETRAGNVDVDAWCGFSLIVRTDAGNVRAAAACQPERMELRTNTGAVNALVPPGRYRVDADSDEGASQVDGIELADDAPFRIQALSGSGDVLVEAQ